MNASARPFRAYANFYDQMYLSKDYSAESDFIEKAAKEHSTNKVASILDLGCGTGGHAILLAERGYTVHGVDLSGEMLAQAKKKAALSKAKEKLTFSEGDIAALSLGASFDQVICMFAVLSYQTTNDKLIGVFKGVREHLKPGGVFVADFWYGPAVLRDPPASSEKVIDVEGIKTKRSASSEVDYNTHIVKVSYDIRRLDNAPGDPVRESHYMRYLFLPELSLIADLAGLKLVKACDCCNLNGLPSEQTWTVSAVFKG